MKNSMESDHDKLIKIEQNMSNNYHNTENMIRDLKSSMEDIKKSLVSIQAAFDSKIVSNERRITDLENFKIGYVEKQEYRNKVYTRNTTAVAIIASIASVLVYIFFQLIFHLKI